MSKLIAKLLREKRQELGLTQQALSQHLGLSSSQYISNIERELCAVSVDSLVKLSELLKINEHKLIEVMVEEYRQTLKTKLKKARAR